MHVVLPGLENTDGGSHHVLLPWHNKKKQTIKATDFILTPMGHLCLNNITPSHTTMDGGGVSTFKPQNPKMYEGDF